MIKWCAAFFSGLVCGGLAIAGWFRVWEPAAEARDTSAEKKPAARAHGNLDTRDAAGKTAEDGMTAQALEARVAALRAWTEGRGAEPAGDALYTTVEQWAKNDPRAALAWASSAKRLPQRMQVLAVPLAALARENPAEAVAWLQQTIEPADRGMLLDAAFQRLALDDPRAALSWVTLAPERYQPDDWGMALGALVVDAPQEALGFFDRLTGQRRETSARWMLASWAQKDAAGALAWLGAQADLATLTDVRWGFLDACVRARPELTLEFWKKFPPGPESYGDSQVIGQLLQRSPEHGLEALALATPEGAEVALAAWARENFERSPERALEWTRRWVEASRRADVIRGGFESWLESDERAAREWFATVTQPELQTMLRPELLAWQARRDPEAALRMLNGPEAGSPEMREVVTQTLMDLGQRDVAAAAAWTVANAALVPAEQAAIIASRYLEKDEAAGADWLAKMPAGGARDAAVETAAIYWAERMEPELAAQVAGSIRDTEKRTRTFFSMYATLRSADPAAAEQWLNATPELTEETKQSWRAIAGSR